MNHNGTDQLREKVVGRMLAKWRQSAGLTQADLAGNLGYSTAQFISNWERGVSLPPLATLPKVAALLKVPARTMIAVMHQYQDAVLGLEKKTLVDLFKKTKVR